MACFRLPLARPRSTILAGALALLALAGCSSNDKFAPACPQLALLAEGADLTRFAGPGRDVTDRVLEARITGVDASCKPGRRGDVVAVLAVRLDVMRGPASASRSANVPYFVAISDAGAVIDRRAFTVAATFPANVDKISVAGEELELRFPAGGKAAGYKIYVSLQLNEDELAYNRRRTGP